jgi:hypothetical protein
MARTRIRLLLLKELRSLSWRSRRLKGDQADDKLPAYAQLNMAKHPDDSRIELIETGAS